MYNVLHQEKCFTEGSFLFSQVVAVGTEVKATPPVGCSNSTPPPKPVILHLSSKGVTPFLSEKTVLSYAISPFSLLPCAHRGGQVYSCGFTRNLATVG